MFSLKIKQAPSLIWLEMQIFFLESGVRYGVYIKKNFLLAVSNFEGFIREFLS